jgi:SulP family sulfate permease
MRLSQNVESRCIRLHKSVGEPATRDIPLRIVTAHGCLRGLLRAHGISEEVSGPDWVVELNELLGNALPVRG